MFLEKFPYRVKFYTKHVSALSDSAMPPSFPKRNRKAAFPVKSPMITSFSPLLLPLWAEERVTDIQFYFVVLIDIFYYGRGLGHTFGVRVDGPLARGFLRFLSLTAFQAEGGGGG